MGAPELGYLLTGAAGKEGGGSTTLRKEETAEEGENGL